MGDEDMVCAGVYRVVCNRRARKLRKRGEFVQWSVELNSYYWEPDWLAPNQQTDNGLPWIGHAEYLRQTAV